MGFVSGLAAIKEIQDSRPSGDFKERVKATWVSLKAGEEVKLVFLQEIDEGSPKYSEKNGLAKFFLEHSNPDNWRKSAECTANEGSCYACDQGWRQKTVFYVNVLVQKGKEDPYVAVLSRGLGKTSIVNTLLKMAGSEDYDLSITDKTFTFSREGSTKDDTVYTLSNLGKPHKFNVEDFELFDLEGVPFHVDPSRQENYYTDGASGAGKGVAAAEPAKPVSASSVDADW